MTTGGCIIDGLDIATLGMFIERGGSDDFLSFPERRAPDQNDWAEHDGLDVDLSDLSFEAKKVTVHYVLAAGEMEFKSRLNAFETLHFAPGIREVYVREFGLLFRLRFLGFSDYAHRGGLVMAGKKVARIAAEYSMDDPLQFYAPGAAPAGGRTGPTHVALDGDDLSRYGIVVREVYSTALRPRSAKPALERIVAGISGTDADTGDGPKKRPREIVIACTMLAPSPASLMDNLSALWARLNVTAPVKLHVGGEGRNCYYTKMGNFKKETPFERKVKVSFELHLQEFGTVQLRRLLAAQDGRRVITQDGRYINLNY